jgi:hypothetical protein
MLTLSSHLELGKSRVQTLSWLIIGVINARTVNLSHVASQFAGAAQVSSSYRRVQRFFPACAAGRGLVGCGCRQAHEDQAAMGLVPGSHQLENRAA